ncbi:hypothetical protein HYZ41_01605 [archaeon]|nr:hypothetical protein [archaeon]
MNVIYSKKGKDENALKMYAGFHDDKYAYAALKINGKNRMAIIPSTKIFNERDVFTSLFSEEEYTIAIKTTIDFQPIDHYLRDLMNVTEKTEDVWREILEKVKETPHYGMLDNF